MLYMNMAVKRTFGYDPVFCIMLRLIHNVHTFGAADVIEDGFTRF